MAHNKTEQLRTFHLFAGAGGGILADLLLGHIPVGACEIEDYPRAVLLQRQRDGILPQFPIWDDICTFDGKPWRGLIDIVAGGFPCQDISSAGKGAGIKGSRSGLWVEMQRVVSEIQPAHVFVENSPNLVSRGLAVVIGDLAEMGYDARWCVLGSDAVGRNHQRKRMWVYANSNNRQKWREQLVGNGWESSDSDVKKMRVHYSGYEGKKEPVIPRVANGVANQLDRTTAIGNGQDPRVAATAWKILTKGEA